METQYLVKPFITAKLFEDKFTVEDTTVNEGYKTKLQFKIEERY